MLERGTLSGEIATGLVQKMSLTHIDEIQVLTVSPRTTIKRHSHESGQWEIWIRVSKGQSYVCLEGQTHELVNTSNSKETIFAIKGSGNESFGDIISFLMELGVTINQGDMKI